MTKVPHHGSRRGRFWLTGTRLSMLGFESLAGGPTVSYKTVRIAVRSDRPNSTVTLAVRRPDSKDEAACAVQAAGDVRKRLPGMLAISYDTALRGTHIRELARSSRLVTIAPVAAKSNTKGRRTEKSGHVADFHHRRADGVTCEHIFYHHAGQLCQQRIDANGKKTLVPCADPFVRFRDNKNDYPDVPQLGGPLLRRPGLRRSPGQGG